MKHRKASKQSAPRPGAMIPKRLPRADQHAPVHRQQRWRALRRRKAAGFPPRAAHLSRRRAGMCGHADRRSSMETSSPFCLPSSLRLVQFQRPPGSCETPLCCVENACREKCPNPHPPRDDSPPILRRWPAGPHVRVSPPASEAAPQLNAPYAPLAMERGTACYRRARSSPGFFGWAGTAVRAYVQPMHEREGKGKYASLSCCWRIETAVGAVVGWRV